MGLRYCIQENIGTHFIFAPFAFVVSRQVLDWVNSKSFLNSSILEKLFFSNWVNSRQRKSVASVKGKNYMGQKITLYTVLICILKVATIISCAQRRSFHGGSLIDA